VHDRLKSIGKTLAPAFAAMLFLLNAPCQTTTSGPASPFASASPFSADDAATFVAAPTFDVSALPAGTFADDAAGSVATQNTEQHGGFLARAVHRTLQDQKGIYLAPFEPSHFKWDAIVVGGAAVFFVTDRHIENNVPNSHYQFWQDSWAGSGCTVSRPSTITPAKLANSNWKHW
jgi:hypothetical protein